MRLKVKIFVTREEDTLAQKINDFIKDKKINNIQYSTSFNGANPTTYYSVSFSAMITYEEEEDKE